MSDDGWEAMAEWKKTDQTSRFGNDDKLPLSVYVENSYGVVGNRRLMTMDSITVGEASVV